MRSLPLLALLGLGVAVTEEPPMSQSTSGAKNRLAAESSPYLLLHQGNPVDWFPWGEEALARARAEDKPIFLSVGYSTCYWCHVMERESFSSPTVAAILNKHFVSIKLDREERPDLDEIYMAATQILGGHGGWPNSVFMTPELKPFYAGTYFPPEDRHGLPGFGTLLLSIADAWKNRRGQVNDQADEVAKVMQRYLGERAAPAESVPGLEAVERSREALARRFDRDWGGFSPAPKFPTPSNLFFLHELAGESPEAAEMLSVTLDRMARGGLFDHLAGGFHRYATDREWLVPHFEKMLYDNGFLLEIYAREHARSGEPEWARVAEETATFLAAEMTSAEGAFVSAIDAETHGHEGAFYVWERGELRAVLGAEDDLFLAPLLGFDRPPFFEGTAYVLHLPRSIAEVARERRLSREALLAEMAPLKAKLRQARAVRERPLTDDKILTDWNGIAIAGMVAAGEALGKAEWIDRAERAARFVLEKMRPAGGPLQHVWRLGKAKVPAQLADYALLVRGLLALDRARPGNGEWLRAARELTEEQILRLRDPEGGFFVAEAGADTLVRSKESLDGATPSANAIAASNLVALALRTGEDRYRAEAEATLRAFGEIIERAPDATRMLVLASRQLHRAFPREATRGALESEARSVVSARLEPGEAREGGWRAFVLHLEIASGWHLNANPASEEMLIATELEPAGSELRGVVYPPARERAFSFAQVPLAVYEGAIEIRGEARAVDSKIELLLRYQPCDESRCLPPVERTLTTSITP